MNHKKAKTNEDIRIKFYSVLDKSSHNRKMNSSKQIHTLFEFKKINERKDQFGSVIKKGVKIHRLTFADQLGRKLLDIVPVESSKEYNVIEEEDFYDKKSEKLKCMIY